MDPEKLNVSTTTNGQPPEPGHEHGGAPAPIDPSTGQHKAYWVLSEEERAKGFVRPVRRTYLHVGQAVCGKRPNWGDAEPGKVFICTAPPGHDGECSQGRSVTPEEAERAEKRHVFGGCGTETTMGQAIAETYARDPKYYGATFCCACRSHFPVGEHGQFVWENGERVGT